MIEINFNFDKGELDRAFEAAKTDLIEAGRERLQAVFDTIYRTSGDGTFDQIKQRLDAAAKQAGLNLGETRLSRYATAIVSGIRVVVTTE
jgi:hypothetical protein